MEKHALKIKNFKKLRRNAGPNIKKDIKRLRDITHHVVGKMGQKVTS